MMYDLGRVGFRRIAKTFRFTNLEDSWRHLSNHGQHLPKEVSIKVPWGHIAGGDSTLGLHWNYESTSAHPFICLHGWKDNAATFNRIIPHLLNNSLDCQFLAFDLPGHGFSSHYPPGMLYQMVDHLIAIRRVVANFGWSHEGIHLLGHSLGAMLSFLFAASHPKLVDCVIAIDALVPIVFNKADLVNMLKLTTEGILTMESQSIIQSTKTYQRNELREKLIKSHLGISEEACDVLITRSIVETAPKSGKWKFSHDPRVQFLPLMCISTDLIETFAKSFRSKLLLIKSESGVNYLSEYMEADIQKWLAKNNRQHIRYVTASKATHHVHLEEPEKITPAILEFLKATHRK